MSSRPPKLTEDEERLRKTVAAMLEASRAGRLPWLDALLEDAGYIRLDRGMRQKTLAEAIPRKTLREWEQDGAPTATGAGRAKYYPPVALVRFLVDRYTKGSSSEAAEAAAIKLDLARIDREERAHDLAEKKGAVVQRTQADADLLAIAIEFRAVLGALPGEVHEAVKLALTIELHQELQDIADSDQVNMNRLTLTLARAVTKTLRRHVASICRSLANGQVPVPPDVVVALDQLIEAATSSTAD